MNKTSLSRLSTCHKDIQDLAHAVDRVFPIQCICGVRGKLEQNEAFRKGVSKVKYPKSKHNKIPSEAGDFVPDPDRNPATIDWDDIEAFKEMGRHFKEQAELLGIEITWGGDFTSFKDYPHVERAEDYPSFK